jgi:hypothetical protein
MNIKLLKTVLGIKWGFLYKYIGKVTNSFLDLSDTYLILHHLLLQYFLEYL